MKSIAVFDFDRTMIDDDSDATVINRLREKQPPPEWNSTGQDWTPYMSDIFEKAFEAGLSKKDILDCIESIPAIRGVERLLTTLADRGWNVLIITDANTVFVQHWLETRRLEDKITAVISNNAYFKQDRLYITPCMHQTACRQCPSNMCKSLALAQWLSNHDAYDNISYIGDGMNDFCPATNLPQHAFVFPRRGYTLDGLIKKTLATPRPLIKATVVPWDDHNVITKTLFPDEKIEC